MSLICHPNILKAIRNNSVYKLELWLAKKLSDGKYDDRVLQTENVHYYVMETGNASGAIYKIRQNSIDLTIIKNALETAIETKRGVVEEIKALQNENAKKTNELKLSLNKATAEDDQGLIFTEALIRELNRFIIEKEYTNENIGVADINTDIQTSKYKERVDELYQDGMTVFYSKATPLVEFNIDIVNFMRDIRYQKDWDKISLGDMIHITHGDASKKDYIVRITQIQWNPTDNFLQLTLSNEDKLTSSQGFMEKMIRKINTTATTVSVQKEKWNNAQSNAVEEILNTGWNDGLSKMYEKTDITLNEYGITMANLLDKNKQTRMNGNMLIFTEDNWNTVKTAISNGDIFAERLVGRIILGTMAYLSGYKSDGTTGTCRIDGEGVLIDNGSLNVKPMDGNYANSNGITISPESDGGIVCTGYDENGVPVYRLRMNGKTGFDIFSLNANGEEKEELFHANVKGHLMANGDAYLKRLFLVGMDGDVATAMDALKLNDKGNTSIGGDYINAKGIQVKKGSKTTFEVSEDGDVTGRDCVFRDGTFTGTFEAGSITSNTTIDVGTNIVVGDNMTLGKHSTTGTINFGGMTSTPTAKISGYENNGKFLELEAENILLDVATDGGGKVYVGSVYGDNEVLTKDDLETINRTILSLSGRIEALENHLGI